MAGLLARGAALGLRVATVGCSVPAVTALPATDFGEHEGGEGFGVLALMLEVVGAVAVRAVFLRTSVLGQDTFEDIAFSWNAV